MARVRDRFLSAQKRFERVERLPGFGQLEVESIDG
jgi:hypothetical protein